MELEHLKAIEGFFTVTRFTSLNSTGIQKTFKAELHNQFTETIGILFT